MTRALSVVAALAMLGAACSGGGSAGPPFEVPGEPVATTEVDMPMSYRFEPAAIRVDAGSTVTWTNNDSFPHTVHVLEGAPEVDEPVPIGGQVEITMRQSGTVYYECSLHPQQMKGKVIVR